MYDKTFYAQLPIDHQSGSTAKQYFAEILNYQPIRPDKTPALGGCFGRSAVPRPRYPLRDTPGPYRDTPGPYRDGAGPYRHCAAQYRHTIPPPPFPRHSPSPHPTRSRTRPETVPVPTDTVTATQHCRTLISDIC